MYRDILTNKWFLGGVGFLIVLSVACVLWYQHDIADERKAAADAEEMLRQSEIAKKVSDADSETEQATNVSVENTTLTTEKPITTEINSEVVENTEVEARVQADIQTPAENAKVTDVQVSPYGFGPYPEMPEDYPTKHLVKWPASSRGAELLSRVLIKLWTEGERDFYGGSTNNGRVYPHYYNTVYTRFGEYRRSNGEIVRYAQGGIAGPHVDFSSYDLLNPPPHLRVLDIETSGIDPYQFLNLPYQKGKKQ
ncbi:hypothetical protein J4G08_05235 [Candidatus Poribacteria bacterium]|nr:hypothetical protein [Candidatus Poribacteria bacterium]